MRHNIELGMFCRNENEKELKLPEDEPIEFSSQEFKDHIAEINKQKRSIVEKTEVILTQDGEHITEDDFEPIKVLGRGAFGKVILAMKKDDHELYAVKIMNKADIVERN